MSRSVPAGYRKLPAGATCRCFRLYQDVGGTYYCCTDISARNTSVVAPPVDLTPAYDALLGPAGRIIQGNPVE